MRTKEETTMACWKFRYPDLFWERENKAVGRLSPSGFRKYLDALRRTGDADSRSRLREIVRKMIERGSCFEGTLFLNPEEVRAFLTRERVWFLDERREPLWKKFAGLPPDFPLRHVRDGDRGSSVNSSSTCSGSPS